MISADRHANSCYNSSIEQDPQDQQLSFGFINVVTRCVNIAGKMVQYAKENTASIIQGNVNYTLHAKHNISKISLTLKAYIYFGDDLIVPAVNNLQEDYLEEIFNQEILNKSSEGNEDTLLNEKGDNLRGFCFALSLQFIREFFDIEETQRGPQTIKKIGEKFMNGSPKELVEKQKNQCSKHTVNNINHNSITKANEISEEVNEIVNSNKTPLEIDTLQIEPNDTQDLPSESLKDRLEKLSNIIDSDQVPKGEFIRLNFNLSSVAVSKQVITSTPNTTNPLSGEECLITEFTTESLLPGAYIIYSSSYKESKKNPLAPGHATAYIKCETGPNYLYEPNLGTVQIPPGKDVEYITYCLDYLNFDQLYLTGYKPITVNQNTNTFSSL